VGGSPRTERTSGFLGGSWRVVVRRGGKTGGRKVRGSPQGWLLPRRRNFQRTQDMNVVDPCSVETAFDIILAHTLKVSGESGL